MPRTAVDYVILRVALFIATADSGRTMDGNAFGIWAPVFEYHYSEDKRLSP